MPNYIIDPSQTVGDALPTVYINRITLSGEDDDLGVELTLTIKDIIGNGGITQWLNAGTLPNNKTIKDYIKVKVYQTVTQQATTEFSTIMLDGDIRLGTRSIPGASSLELDLVDFDDSQTPFNHMREYDKDGNTVITTTKTINSREFTKLAHQDNLTINTNCLSYFVWSELDTGALANDFKIDGNSFDIFQGIPGVFGKANSDTVFRAGKLMSEGYVFYEANLSGPNSTLVKTDKLWTGPYHYHKDFFYTIPGTSTSVSYTGYMGGARHHPDQNQPLLMKQTVKNSKIQDFRTVERIQKTQLDFSSIENNLLQSFNGNRKTIDKKGKFSFFTDIWMTRDIDNNSRFMFGIDLRKIVRENTPYSILFSTENYNNPLWLQEAMKKVTISSLKIYRERIRGTSELNDSPYNFPNNNSFSPADPLTVRRFNNGALRGNK